MYKSKAWRWGVGCVACLLALFLHDGQAADGVALRKVLVVGFGSFGGRAVNGSSLGAKAVAGKDARAEIVAAEVPVIWGAPRKELMPLLEKETPEILICLGEGYPGFFTLEALGRNKRGAIKDVEGNLPPVAVNEEGGPDEVAASAPVLQMAKRLTEKGYPTHVSTDAGRYLCDEMLYTIERLKVKYPSLKLVVFSHMPPQEQAVILDTGVVKMNEQLAGAYTRALVVVALDMVEDGE